MINLCGDANITNQISDLDKYRYTHKIILIGDYNKDLIANYNMVGGSLFMPPYEEVMIEIEGDFNGFREAYYKHLFSTEVQEYVALIFRALYEGNNILFYLTEEESEMPYSKIFLEYLSNVFGLTVTPVGTPASFNVNYTDMVCDLLYFNNLFSYTEYLLNRNDTLISPMILQKLVMEIDPYVGSPTEENYQTYFSHLQRSIKQMASPIMPGLIRDERGPL